MSESQLPTVPSPSRLVDSPRRTWRRRIRRGVVIYVLVPYLSVIAILFAFQRKLIYHPSRSGSISPSDSGLPDGNVHTIHYTTRDGLELRGWHVLADGQTAQTHQDCEEELNSDRLLVLYFPGNAGNRSSRAADCRDFTELAADVFLFDYRGYGENPGAPSELHFAGDAQSIWKYVTEDRHVAADRIVIYGESLGGGVATRLTAELCESGHPPAGLILSSTFSSLVDTAAEQYPFLPTRLMMLDQFSSVDRAPSITCPVLHIHGARDAIVPIHLGRRLFAAIPASSANGMEKRFVELPSSGHNDITKADFNAAAGPFLEAIRSGRKRDRD